MINFYAPGSPSVQLTAPEFCAELTRAKQPGSTFTNRRPRKSRCARSRALGINIPTREEMQEIELSSRLYEEGGNLFLTGTVLTKADTSNPESSAVTFILTSEKLVTLRYADPAPFHAFRARREANPLRYQTAEQFFGGLIDAVIERIADILEGAGANMDRISLKVFDAEGSNGHSHWQAQTKTKRKGRARRARPER